MSLLRITLLSTIRSVVFLSFMVGVAGKSKACHDCRRRRVKCDLTVPHCRRCSKAGIKCRGYVRAALWVNRTPNQLDVTVRSAIATAQRDECSNSELSPQSSGGLDSLLQLQASLAGSHQKTGDSLIFRHRAFPILQSTYLPRSSAGYGEHDIDNDPSPLSWVKAVCELQGDSDALDSAILAFCAIQLRLSDASTISHDRTVQLYNDALGKLIKDLSPQQARTDDETLGAIVMLSTCEVFIFSKDTAWTAHAQGISQLLRQRDCPLKATKSSWRSLLRRLCIICEIQAISRRRSLSLEPSNWRRLLGPPDCPGSFSELQDIMMTIPSMVQQTYAMTLASDKQFVDTSHHLKVLTAKHHELDHWQHLYQRSEADRTKAPLYWLVPSRAHNPTDEAYQNQLFPFVLTFSSVQSAVPWMLCMAFTLAVLDCITMLNNLAKQNIGSHGVDIAASDTGSRSEDKLANSFKPVAADGLARKICQSFEFCYRSEHGTFGAQATCFIQCMVLRYFERRGLTRELKWCEAIREMKCEGSSFEIDMIKIGLGPEQDIEMRGPEGLSEN